MRRWVTTIVWWAGALGFLGANLAAQPINSNTANVALNAVLSEGISVTATPGSVNFTLVPNGVAPGSSAVTITTTWVLPPQRTILRTFAYFVNSNAALTNGATPPTNIPSAQVLGSVNGGANRPFTRNSPFATGSALLVFRRRILGGNNFSGSHTDTLALSITLVGFTIPTGTYTGTMVVQAQAP